MASPETAAAGGGVRAVHRAVRLLHVLAESDAPLGILEIADRLSLAQSTTHRLLATLQRDGLVEKDPATHRYRVGSAVIQLAARPILNEERLRHAARTGLGQLVAMTNETGHLAVLRGTKVVTIDLVESREPLLVRHPIGSVLPAHATALGHILLAHTPHVAAAVMAEGLARLTPFTITDPDELRQELARVRARRYAVNFRQRNVETAGVAAAVFEEKRLVAAVGLTGPSVRISPDRLDDLGREVRDAAARLSDELSQAESPSGGSAAR